MFVSRLKVLPTTELSYEFGPHSFITMSDVNCKIYPHYHTEAVDITTTRTEVWRTGKFPFEFISKSATLQLPHKRSTQITTQLFDHKQGKEISVIFVLVSFLL